MIIGGGGREHALAWRLGQDPGVTEVIACPGNPGLRQIGRTIPLPAPVNLETYADLAVREHVDLTIVGPEATLVSGIVDRFNLRGLPIVGPTQAAARLEGSKIFAKEFFARAGIPTAVSVQAATVAEGLEALRRFPLPVVIKADGLAGGKGVIVAYTQAEAQEAVDKLGPLLVIEEFLEGEEVSFIGISNGDELVPFEASQDHKRLSDDDSGPNTGGMGAYCDGRIITPAQADDIMDKVMLPAIRRMALEGTPFTGFLYAGLMMTAAGPKILEFNVRLGDPETQVLMHRLDADFLPLLQFSAGTSGQPASLLSTRARPDPSVCVVAVTAGYPERPCIGDSIEGIEAAESMGATVFHAGTSNADGILKTSGGRVLGITASGSTLPAAIDSAYAAVSKIHFDGMHFRRDIGRKGRRRW
jgi:phosphoribosylamine--glycine ligase